jgi:NitT/TauT family transport system ATP-binding protein
VVNVVQNNGAKPDVAPLDRKVLLEVRGVHKVYDVEDGVVHALKDVSLSIFGSEVVTLIGRSGCGKSTLLNMLSGLDRPSAGAVRFGGLDVVEPLYRQVGYVFQQPVLLPWRSILDNVLLGAELMRLPKKAMVARARDLLDLVELSGFEKRFPHQLSGGMQQRAAIVRAMIHEPDVLLMDEPFGALDAMTREHMNIQLLRLQRATGTTVVFVTHDLREAAFLSDRVVVMTPRPGAIRTVIDTTLPAHRDADTLYCDEFKDLTRELHTLIA